MIAALAAAVVAAGQPALPLRPCSVQGIDARCGTYHVPENRAKPDGKQIPLKVVVIPAVRKPARPDAFTFLSGGPGGASATEMPSSAVAIWGDVHERHDILLVDQRGTGGSNELKCTWPHAQLSHAQVKAFVARCIRALPGNLRYYGTRTAADDLEAVRKILGYRSLDVYGTSYGATTAQAYLLRHPRSVRTLMLDGGTFVDVPFYSRFAINAQRALDLLARRCTKDTACRDHFPDWRKQFAELVPKWNRDPVKVGDRHVTGNDLAGVVQQLLLDASSAARIPLLVSEAADHHYDLLENDLGDGTPINSLMYWTIWCNEPWVGLGARGPWHTLFDGFATESIAEHRQACAFIPKRHEPASAWGRPHSKVPMLAIVGQADPQDPIGNLPGLHAAFPNSRVITAPDQGHAVGGSGCIGLLVARFVARGAAKGLDTSCVRLIVPSPFQLTD
jgi:pimeloyl-ACP methyl ester carboxylesterase